MDTTYTYTTTQLHKHTKTHTHSPKGKIKVWVCLHLIAGSLVSLSGKGLVYRLLSHMSKCDVISDCSHTDHWERWVMLVSPEPLKLQEYPTRRPSQALSRPHWLPQERQGCAVYLLLHTVHEITDASDWIVSLWLTKEIKEKSISPSHPEVP